ncbi:MAG: VWA-like domain-containing protein [Actinomycetota bacterium]|nr:VWA-like domain-containing protein [Actinomycetota bacterium]
MKPKDQVSAARLWAAYNYPYLASALFALRFVADDKVDQIAGDEHFRVYINYGSAHDWPVEVLGVEMIHQVGHLLRGHAPRAQEIELRESDLFHWVDAMDAELNDDLLDGHVLPEGSASPDELGLSESLFGEEYFFRGTPRNEPQRDCGSSAHGNPRPWDEPPPKQGKDGVTEEEKDLIRQRVASDALTYHRNHGSTPAGMLRWANSLLTPQVDWRAELGAKLRRGIAEIAGAVDYSYQRPNRRQSFASKIILPNLRAPTPEVSVVLDTSASMNEELLADALSEIDGLLSTGGIRFESVRVFTCDSEAGSPQKVRKASEIQLIGGGGTDLSQGILAAVQTRPSPDLLLVVTDGGTLWPESPPSRTRTIAVLVGDDPPSTPDWLERVVVKESDSRNREWAAKSSHIASL